VTDPSTRIPCATYGCDGATTETLYVCGDCHAAWRSAMTGPATPAAAGHAAVRAALKARREAGATAGHRHAGRTITTRHGDLVECRSCGQVVPASEVAV
jgi:hypothetical protein